MNFRKILFLLSIALFFTACQRAEQKTAASAEAKRYELSGKVISVDRAARKAKIEHDEIAGYMKSMTMDFPIKQEWVIRELKPNDKIAADLVVEPDNTFWLEEVKIMTLGRDESGAQSEAGKNLIGVEVPDFKLTNQDGKRFSLTDYRGKNLVLTFIFTRCPDMDMCPLMSLSFSDMEKKIRNSPELAANTKLLSITFDPEFDSPEVLKKYAVGYQGKDAKPNFDIWNLATGTPQEIKNVESFFGASATKGENDRIVHNLRTVLITADGKINKVYAGNTWKKEDILRDLQAVAAK